MKEVTKKTKLKNRDISIQLFRIISMFLIIICHIFDQSPIKQVSQLMNVFNVGNFCFLFLSGYLYSDKEIGNSFNWLKKQIKKILIPMYLFLIILFSINIFNNDFSIKYIFIYMFDLQYYMGYTTGGEHLWFLTIIVLCYFFLIFIKKIVGEKNIIKISITLLILGIVFSFYSFKLGFTMFYLFAFSFGYLYKRYYNKEKKIYKVMVCIVISLSIRLLGKYFFDNNPLYDIIIFSLTHLILACCIYEIVRWFVKKIRLSNNNIINHIDSVSFYIYLTHNIFIAKPLHFLSLTNNYIINLIVALVCSYILALIIKKIYVKINEVVE